MPISLRWISPPGHSRLWTLLRLKTLLIMKLTWSLRLIAISGPNISRERILQEFLLTLWMEDIMLFTRRVMEALCLLTQPCRGLAIACLSAIRCANKVMLILPIQGRVLCNRPRLVSHSNMLSPSRLLQHQFYQLLYQPHHLPRLPHHQLHHLQLLSNSSPKQ